MNLSASTIEIAEFASLSDPRGPGIEACAKRCCSIARNLYIADFLRDLLLFCCSQVVRFQEHETSAQLKRDKYLTTYILSVFLFFINAVKTRTVSRFQSGGTEMQITMDTKVINEGRGGGLARFCVHVPWHGYFGSGIIQVKKIGGFLKSVWPRPSPYPSIFESSQTPYKKIDSERLRF